VTSRVIVVGSVNIDLVARADRLPAPGETVTGAVFSRHHGGKGGNQAVAAARLGASTAFVGAVGSDEFGADARAALSAEGIDVRGLITSDGPTGVALVLVDADGENLISVASGANGALTPAAALEALTSLAPTSADVVLVCHEIPTSTVRAVLEAGRLAGATTILNPAPAVGLDRSTFAFADLITPNRGELATLVAAESRRVGREGRMAASPEAAAASLLQSSSEGSGVSRAVVVTLGSAGAVVVEAGRDPLDVSAFPVNALDSVGAGDAVNGALAAALAAGRPLSEAARWAMAAAALATTRAGAREGMPTIDELEAFIAAR
jgi:ribokinase